MVPKGTVSSMNNAPNARVRAGLNHLLGRLGIERVATYDAVISCANMALAARRHDAVAVGLQHGRLRVAAGGPAAVMLRMDLEQIHREIERAHPGVVTHVVIVRDRGT